MHRTATCWRTIITAPTGCWLMGPVETSWRESARPPHTLMWRWLGPSLWLRHTRTTCTGSCPGTLDKGRHPLSNQRDHSWSLMFKRHVLEWDPYVFTAHFQAWFPHSRYFSGLISHVVSVWCSEVAAHVLKSFACSWLGSWPPLSQDLSFSHLCPSHMLSPSLPMPTRRLCRVL